MPNDETRTWSITYATWADWNDRLIDIANANNLEYLLQDFPYEHWRMFWNDGQLPTEAILHTITSSEHFEIIAKYHWLDED